MDSDLLKNAHLQSALALSIMEGWQLTAEVSSVEARSEQNDPPLLSLRELPPSPQTEHSDSAESFIWADVLVSGPSGRAAVRAPLSIVPALALLGPEPVCEQSLIDALPNGDNDLELLRSALETLVRQGVLGRKVVRNGNVIAQLEPLGNHYHFGFAKPFSSERVPCVLSRFCLLRLENGHIVLESPLAHARLRIFHAAVVASIASLTAHPSGPSRNARGEISTAPSVELLSLLSIEGFLEDPEEGAEDGNLALRHWEFHDLLFHSRSRIGRTSAIVGGSYRFRGEIAPLPGVKPPMSAFPIALPRPDLQSLSFRDLTVTAALESRVSIRHSGARAPTVLELGHFLYRSARVRHCTKYQEIDLTNRPYPNGGASYELEIYPIIDRCAGLLSGVYHYDPVAHALEPLVAPSAATETALCLAYAANGGLVRPSILLVVTARFRRVSWKYESVAYATILKNVGALYQTMYIVATAMRLAPCAIGAGDSDLFSEILGNDYLEESAVGEFMLNARADA